MDVLVGIGIIVGIVVGLGILFALLRPKNTSERITTEPDVQETFTIKNAPATSLKPILPPPAPRPRAARPANTAPRKVGEPINRTSRYADTRRDDSPSPVYTDTSSYTSSYVDSSSSCDSGSSGGGDCGGGGGD